MKQVENKGILEYEEEIRRNKEHRCQFCGEKLPENQKDPLCWACRIAEE